MAPKTPSDADTNTGTSETTVDDSVEKPSIKPAGWTPDLTLPLGSINGELSALTKLTPRDLGLAKQLEGEEDVTDEVETEHIKQKNTETIKSLLNIDQPLAPKDGPEEGNVECRLIHEGTKWFWRPNIHLDLQVYVLEKENCYGLRVNWRDEHLELPYLFLDKAIVDTKLDNDFIENGPKLAPHEALKKQMEGPRRSRILDEEAQQIEDEKKKEEKQQRFYESAANVCLSKLELKKKDNGIVNAFIKGSSLTGETLELVATDEEHQKKINGYRLPKKPFVKPVSASVAEFRRINKLFEKHMDKAKEARASAQDIHQAQNDVINLLKNSIRHTTPSLGRSKFGKKVLSGMKKIHLRQTQNVLSANGQ
eukprot:g9887.t1